MGGSGSRATFASSPRRTPMNADVIDTAISARKKRNPAVRTRRCRGVVSAATISFSMRKDGLVPTPASHDKLPAGMLSSATSGRLAL